MNIIFTGPPGAGKGTMSRLIQEKLNLPVIATGDILREEIKNGTELGNAAKSLIEKGHLVPDDIVIGIVNNAIHRMNNGYMLDGFPRNINQAVELDRILEENNERIDAVININAVDDIIIDRVKNRLICPKCSHPYHAKSNKPMNEGICDFCNVKLVFRKDDEEDNVRRRLEIYHRETKPVIDYYSTKGILHTVESSDSNIEETFVKVTEIIERLIWK